MNLSFLIPALNEEQNIGNCIRSIRAAVPADCSYEVLVGDHGSKDRTAEVATELGANVQRYPKSTVGALRNRIVERASGDVLVFLDADVTLTAEWRARVMDVLNSLRLNPSQITGSICTPPPSDSYFLRYWFRRMPKGQSSYLGTGHMLMAMSHFKSLGGFDPQLISGEDYDICMRSRAGGSPVNIVPELWAIHHDYPTSLREFIRRETWHGVGDFQTWDKFRSSKVAQAAVLFAALHFAFLGGLLFSPPLAVLSLPLLVFFLLASSYFKFKRLTAVERLNNVAIFYSYYLGRAASGVSALLRKFGTQATNSR